MTLDEVDRETRALLERFGFDEALFEELRARVASGELSQRSNVVRGAVEPPHARDLARLPAPGSLNPLRGTRSPGSPWQTGRTRPALVASLTSSPPGPRHSAAPPQACHASCSAPLPPPSGHGLKSFVFCLACPSLRSQKGTPAKKHASWGGLKVNPVGAASAGSSKTGNVMETMNGTTNGKMIVGATLAEGAAGAASKQPPAHVLVNGRVITRIWANRTHWGEIVWRVDQYRKNHPAEIGSHRSLFTGDLQDAMRGLYQAQRWIQRTERRRRRSFFGW